MTQEPTVPGGRPRGLRAELTSHEMREKYRSQVLSSIGGWTGMAITAVPTVVFVAVDAWRGLRWGVVAAIGVAVLFGLYRLVRRQSLQQAASGVGGVVIAAVIAGATGHARDYFLWGILTSFAYGLAFVVSMLVRRPLVGLLWEFLDPIARHHPTDDDVPPEGGGTVAAPPAAFPDESAAEFPAVSAAEFPAVSAAESAVESAVGSAVPDAGAAPPWYRHAQLLRAYQWATAAGALVFVSRGVVQLLLYLWQQTGWLAVARVVMGYPLWIVALLFALWVVRRTRHRLVAPDPTAS